MKIKLDMTCYVIKTKEDYKAYHSNKRMAKGSETIDDVIACIEEAEHLFANEEVYAVELIGEHEATESEICLYQGFRKENVEEEYLGKYSRKQYYDENLESEHIYNFILEYLGIKPNKITTVGELIEMLSGYSEDDEIELRVRYNSTADYSDRRLDVYSDEDRVIVKSLL